LTVRPARQDALPPRRMTTKALANINEIRKLNFLFQDQSLGLLSTRPVCPIQSLGDQLGFCLVATTISYSDRLKSDVNRI